MMRALAGALLAFALAAPAVAQDSSSKNYPNRPITLIVPFPAGGGVDAIGRVVGEKLSVALGQPVLIDNRGGAAGVIGTRIGKAAAPDGYTLVMATSGSIAINPNLYASPGYDPKKDLAPIGLISNTPIVLMAHPSTPERTLADVVAAAKARPGQVNIGTPPPGTASNLAAELFRSIAGDIAIVSYRGTGPLTADVLAGQVPLALNVPAPAMNHLRAGTLRGIAVLASKRCRLLPDVPTSAEAGFPGLLSGLNYGLLAPAGTPRPIVERLNRELRAIVALPDVRAKIEADGGEPMPSSPDEYAADIAAENDRWGRLIRKLGLKVE